MRNFKQQVLAYIKKIPRGKVVSYGQVAAMCGSPRAARQVGGILRACSQAQQLPWWRIINNQGVLSIKGNWTETKELQRLLLQKEGVEVSNNFTVDMVKYRWKGSREKNNKQSTCTGWKT